MGLKQIDYNSKEYKQMVNLRYEILRKPQGLTFKKEYLEKDATDILIASFDEDEILGCCILTPLENGNIRLRQMAVLKKLQGKGIGESIMRFAETLAKDKGYKTIMMHARDNVLGFYEKLGYAIKGTQFIEVKIPHHVMEKNL